MKVQTLSTRQVAKLTGAVGGSAWVMNCISQVEAGSNDIVGACGIYGIVSMFSAMAGDYSELYEIEHTGVRRVALIRL